MLIIIKMMIKMKIDEKQNINRGKNRYISNDDSDGVTKCER